MTKQLPEMFIGSSTKGLHIARSVEVQLEGAATVTVWENFFVLGEGTLETLVNSLHTFDFALMVLSPDDLLNTGGRNYASPRDNVLFELGLFMGGLGRKRTFILSDEGANLKLPSDLAGITRATYKKNRNQSIAGAVSPACAKIIEAIQTQGRLKREPRDAGFAEFSKLGMYRLDYPLLYEELQELLAKSKKIQILKTWFPENQVIAEGLKSAIMQRRPGFTLKLLLCKPESILLQQRSRTALHRAYQGSSVVYQAIENIHKWLGDGSTSKGARASRSYPRVEIGCYDSWPGCPVIWCDRRILMGFYFRGAPSPEWPWISVKEGKWFAKRFEKQFNDLWRLSDTVHLMNAKDRERWLKENQEWKELEPHRSIPQLPKKSSGQTKPGRKGKKP